MAAPQLVQQNRSTGFTKWAVFAAIVVTIAALLAIVGAAEADAHRSAPHSKHKTVGKSKHSARGAKVRANKSRFKSSRRHCRRCGKRGKPAPTIPDGETEAPAPPSPAPSPEPTPQPAPEPTPQPASEPVPPPEPEPQPAPAPEPPPSSGSIYLGATVSGSVYGEDNPPWNMNPWDTFESNVGRKLAILQVHQDWGNVHPDVLEKIRSRGAVPMLITEYNTLAQVSSGSQDAAILAMNSALESYGGPVLFRWNWEMNGDWYPWGGVGKASEWVDAYRHLHDLMTAPNVSWVWNPNIYFPNVAPGPGVPVDPSPWYPGDAYVDWMGADGYNFSGESFATVFAPTYNLFQRLAPTKPVILPEWAASNRSGRKTSFIEEAFELTPSRFPEIRAMVYYNDTLGEGDWDWPLESLATAGQAYREGASDPYYSATPNTTGKLIVP